MSGKHKDNVEIFETMPVRKAVLIQIVPSVLSQMIVLIYNLADTYFVGCLNDPGQTAAVTICYAPFLMLTAVSNLFAVGGASLVSRSLGRHNRDTAGKIASISFWTGLLGALCYCVIFRVFESPLLRICGATDATMSLVCGYAGWAVVIGGTGTVLNVLLANLVRAEGYATVAALGVSLGGILNIFLDPLFILPGGLGLGAEGAGAATAISNAVSALTLLVYILARRKQMAVNLAPRHLKYTGEYLRDILYTGFPSAIQYALTVVAVAALSKFVSSYETEAIAGLGIVKKLDQIPLYFSIGVANGLLPLLAYNYASKNHKRRHQAFKFGCMISLGFALFCVILYETLAPVLTGLFIDDPKTIAYASVFLRIMVIAMPMMSLCYPFIIQFQAIGRVKESLVCSILRKGVLDIPLLFIMNALIPLYGCMTVQPIVDSISLVFALYYYKNIQAGIEAKQDSRYKLKII